MAETQISAFVSTETKAQVEKYARASGVKKGHLIEEALLHHLLALRELPADIVVHPRIVLSAKSGQALAAKLDRKAEPTAKLRALMTRADD